MTTSIDLETLTFKVTDDDAGQRLDVFLAAHIDGLSRTSLKRLIEDGDALVGERVAKPSYKLRSGDLIEVEIPPPPALDLTPEEIPINVVHEDDEIIVVNKPAGMVVHPAAGIRGGTLANAIAYRLELGGQARTSLRPGIVHRLDRDTSGLIVVAKTLNALENLAEQFRARTVFKSYIALVHGRIAESTGRIDQPIARDPRNRTRMSVVRSGREALSLWRVRQSFERFTLLDVEIKTGRTHQIRVHLAWMNHPVVADDTYGGGRDKTVADPKLRASINRLGRQFLHAERLGFKHPRTGEWLKFTSALPNELSDFLALLKS
jgi:23S rRNA pseudouridine1911/1915/1917 synthase